MLTPEQVKQARLEVGLDKPEETPTASASTSTAKGISDERWAEIMGAAEERKESLPKDTRGEFAKGVGKQVLQVFKSMSSGGERLLGSIGRSVLPKGAEEALGIENAPTLDILGKTGLREEQAPVETSAELGQREIEQNLGMKEGQLTTPQNWQQAAGYGAAEIAEFFIPVGGMVKAAGTAAKGAKLLSSAPKLVQEGIELLAKAGTEATLMTGVTAAQGKTEGLGTAAAITAGIPVVGKVLGVASAPLKKYLAEKISPRIINSITRPVIKAFNFGKTPGRGVTREGITANSRGGLMSKINAKVEEIGKTIENELVKHEDKVVDITSTIDILDDAATKAVNSGEQALLNRLESIKDGLTKVFKRNAEGKIEAIPNVSRQLRMTPKEAHAIKKEIGKATRWTNQPFDDDVNAVRVKLYQDINNKIDEVVPGVKKTQKRYSDLLTDETALDRTLKTEERKRMIGAGDIGAFGVGSVVGLQESIKDGNTSADALVYGLMAGISRRALGSTAFKTRFAKTLGNLSPDEKTALSQAVPILRNIYLGLQGKVKETGIEPPTQ